MSSGFDVVMTSAFLAEPAVAILEAAGCRIHYMRPYPSAEEVAARTREVQAHAILTRQGPVTALALDASPNLRVVARHGVGVDDVDVAGANQRGILVARAPGSNALAVAEHTMAMLLALAQDFRSLGHGDINFEEIIVALNDVGYRGPLSVEWEDGRMDRVHGATEAATFVKKLDFAPSKLAFDAAFDKKNQ